MSSRIRLPNAEARRLARELRRAGWTVAPTGAGHLRWTAPDGTMIFSASTPRRRGDLRRRLLADARRAQRQGAAP